MKASAENSTLTTALKDLAQELRVSDADMQQAVLLVGSDPQEIAKYFWEQKVKQVVTTPGTSV